MAPVTQHDEAAMDDMAAWGSSNVFSLPRAHVPAPSNTALRQSLNHYCNAGRVTPKQEKHAHALLRAHFLKAEAAVLLDEQWTEYEAASDGPVDRADSFHLNSSLHAWSIWDKRMHDLYHSLLERAEAAEAEAKYGASAL